MDKAAQVYNKYFYKFGMARVPSLQSWDDVISQVKSHTRLKPKLDRVTRMKSVTSNRNEGKDIIEKVLPEIDIVKTKMNIGDKGVVQTKNHQLIFHRANPDWGESGDMHMSTYYTKDMPIQKRFGEKLINFTDASLKKKIKDK